MCTQSTGTCGRGQKTREMRQVGQRQAKPVTGNQSRKVLSSIKDSEDLAVSDWGAGP